MLTKNFFLWPYKENSLQPAVDDLYPVLTKSALSPWLNTSDGNLAEHIALVCRLWNVNPWWIMVTGQREQSTLGTLPENFKLSAKQAWLGFVGQDVGRVTRPGYYGIYTQIQRCCEQTAWLLGEEPASKWPKYITKTTPRFRAGMKMTIERNGYQRTYYPPDAGFYVALAYTPHYQVLSTNYLIAKRYVPMKYQTPENGFTS